MNITESDNVGINPASNAEQERIASDEKQPEQGNNIRRWFILSGVIIIGTCVIIAAYFFIIKPKSRLIDNQARIKLVVSTGDSIVNTADKIAKISYETYQKYPDINQILISLYIIHHKVAGSDYMGDILEDIGEVRKYSDVVSYVNASREKFVAKISSLKYADFLKR